MFIFLMYNRIGNKKNTTGKKHWIISTGCNDRRNTWATFSTHCVFSGYEKKQPKKKKNTNHHTWEALFTAGGSVLFTPNGLCESKSSKSHLLWKFQQCFWNPLSHSINDSIQWKFSCCYIPCYIPVPWYISKPHNDLTPLLYCLFYINLESFWVNLNNDCSLAHCDQEQSPLLLELICSLESPHYSGPICFWTMPNWEMIP